MDLPLTLGIAYCNALIARGNWRGCAAVTDGRNCAGCAMKPDCAAAAEFDGLEDRVNKARDALRADILG